MKLDELLKLGILEEQAKQIVSMSDTEIAVLQKQISDKDIEIKTAKDSLKDLNDKVKAFDGVDPEKLKSDLETANKKYDEDISKLKIDNAIALALTSSDTLDADIVSSLIDKSIVKLGDDGKLLGFDEQLNKIKADKTFLFKSDNASTDNEASKMSTGMKATVNRPTGNSNGLSINSALSEHYST